MENAKNNKAAGQVTLIALILCYAYIFLTLFTVERGIDYLRLLGLVLFVGIGFFLDNEKLLCLIVILQPFEYVFKIPNSYTVLPILITICSLKILVLSKTKIDATKLLLYGSMLVCSLVASFVAFGSFPSIIPFFVYLLFFSLCLREMRDTIWKVFDHAAVLFTISALVFCLAAQLFPNAVRTIAPDGDNQYVYRFYGFSTIWETGRMLVVANAFILARFMQRRNHILLSIAAVGILSYFLVETGLYSALLALVVVALLLPFAGNADPKKKVIRFMLMLFIGAGALVAAYYLIYMPMVELRGTMDDNGRFEIWQLYLRDFIGRPNITLIGVGGGNILKYASSLDRMTAHNLLLEKLIELGLIGTALLVAYLARCFKGFELNPTKNLHLLPLFAFLGTCITQGTSGSELIFLLMILCVVPKEAPQPQQAPAFRRQKKPAAVLSGSLPDRAKTNGKTTSSEV